VREQDLFGRWRVVRTSSAYVFRDPQPSLAGVSAISSLAPAPDPDSPLERALRRLGSVIEGRLLWNEQPDG
jgi:hypothetical protein